MAWWRRWGWWWWFVWWCWGSIPTNQRAQNQTAIQTTLPPPAAPPPLAAIFKALKKLIKEDRYHYHINRIWASTIPAGSYLHRARERRIWKWSTLIIIVIIFIENIKINDHNPRRKRLKIIDLTQSSFLFSFSSHWTWIPHLRQDCLGIPGPQFSQHSS